LNFNLKTTRPWKHRSLLETNLMNLINIYVVKVLVPLFTRLNGPYHRHKSCWLLKMSFYFSFIYFNHFLVLPTVSIRFYALATIMRPLFSNTSTHIIHPQKRWSLQYIWCAFNILLRHRADKRPCNDCNFNWEESNKIIFSRLINRYCTTRANGRMKYKKPTIACILQPTFMVQPSSFTTKFSLMVRLNGPERFNYYCTLTMHEW